MIRKNFYRSLTGAVVIIMLAIISGCNGGEETPAAAKENPPLVPYWALGHLVWEDSINTQEAAQQLVLGYLGRRIPVDGIIIDSPWEMSYNDFTWDRNRYPLPDSMIGFFMRNGVRTLLWMTGNINSESKDVPLQKAPTYDEVIRKGFAVNNGEPYKWWKGMGVQLDFTNPAACEWWDRQLDKVFVPGVYGWKTDQGEHSLPGDTVLTHIGRIPKREFKKYYYAHMYDYTVQRNPEGIILARPYSHQGGYAAPIDKGGVGWCGDFAGDWKGLKKQINNIYVSVNAGYGAVACEIGGFYGARSGKEQFIRYAQFGAMVAMMDNGGANGAFTNHLPWYHDAGTEAIYRGLVYMHRALRPYIFSALVGDHLGGKPWMTVVSMEQYSHLLGEDLFFRAITSDSAAVEITLPENGPWYDWWTGREYKGGAKVLREYSLEESPLFIRKGAMIPFDLDGLECPALEKYKGKKVILLYAPEDGEWLFHEPAGSGREYQDVKIVCRGNTLTIDGGAPDDYVVFVKRAGQPVVSPPQTDCSFNPLADAVRATKEKDHLILPAPQK